MNILSTSSENNLYTMEETSFESHQTTENVQDYQLALSILLKIGSGYLRNVSTNATYYHMECDENGVTPIRHLLVYYLMGFYNVVHDFGRRKSPLYKAVIKIRKHLFHLHQSTISLNRHY